MTMKKIYICPECEIIDTEYNDICEAPIIFSRTTGNSGSNNGNGSDDGGGAPDLGDTSTPPPPPEDAKGYGYNNIFIWDDDDY